MFNRFTRGYEYYIAFSGGTHVVKRVYEGFDSEPEVMYKGTYTQCRTYIEEQIRQNYEYDNDL